jgi:uncharacterized protein (DUF952 family)
MMQMTVRFTRGVLPCLLAVVVAVLLTTASAAGAMMTPVASNERSTQTQMQTPTTTDESMAIELMAPVCAPRQSRYAYKLLTLKQLKGALAINKYIGSPLDKSSGFMHMATAALTPTVASKFYAGTNDTMMLIVNLDKCPATSIKWEVAGASLYLYPHLYHGPLLLNYTAGYKKLVRDEKTGHFVFSSGFFEPADVPEN